MELEVIWGNFRILRIVPGRSCEYVYLDFKFSTNCTCPEYELQQLKGSVIEVTSSWYSPFTATNFMVKLFFNSHTLLYLEMTDSNWNSNGPL